MANEQAKAKYEYRCADYGRVDCGYVHTSDDEAEFRSAVKDHHDGAHRPGDYDPKAIDALILMKSVEP